MAFNWTQHNKANQSHLFLLLTGSPRGGALSVLGLRRQSQRANPGSAPPSPLPPLKISLAASATSLAGSLTPTLAPPPAGGGTGGSSGTLARSASEGNVCSAGESNSRGGEFENEKSGGAAENRPRVHSDSVGEQAAGDAPPLPISPRFMDGGVNGGGSSVFGGVGTPTDEMGSECSTSRGRTAVKSLSSGYMSDDIADIREG